jgi:hypothetical protein
MAVVAESGPFTVRLKVAVPVAPFVSVAVTVYVVVALAAAGVPVMAPVAGAMVRLAGRAGKTV